MIHNYRLNNKINFLLEADLSADTRFIQPVTVDQQQYPFVAPEDMHGPPKPDYENDDPGVEIDIEKIIRDHPGFNPSVYKRFRDWAQSLTREQILWFNITNLTSWPVFLAQTGWDLFSEFPEIDPLLAPLPGNYPENFQPWPVGGQYAPKKP